jgi:hypothetical protein
MSTTNIVIATVSFMSAGDYGLLRYWLRLDFLRSAFERNGDREHLKVAGKVTAPVSSSVVTATRAGGKVGSE